jgi:RNA polymerase sigma-70 factor (ECF subfamily)
MLKITRCPVDLTGADDASILRLIAHRNSEALGILYDRYGRLVYSIALNTINNTETAEEIAQDVFTRVWEKAVSYNPEQAKVSTWLMTITRNRAIDELRRLKNRPEVTSVEWAETILDADPDDHGPEVTAEMHWQQRSVREAVNALPHEQRQVLALAYYKGYSHSEIAEALGQPLGTVKTRLRQAMIRLRQVLSAQVLEDSIDDG